MRNTIRSTRRSTRKPSVRRALVQASAATAFWEHDGKVLYNLKDLLAALRKIDGEIFAFHVTKEKNDYADWTAVVLGDKELARTLRRIRTLRTTIQKIAKRLEEYA